LRNCNESFNSSTEYVICPSFSLLNLNTDFGLLVNLFCVMSLYKLQTLSKFISCNINDSMKIMSCEI
jgi:hypothetical protein